MLITLEEVIIIAYILSHHVSFASHQHLFSGVVIVVNGINKWFHNQLRLKTKELCEFRHFQKLIVFFFKIS